MNKNFGVLFAIITGLGILGYSLLKFLLPAYLPAWYLAIPAFYLLNACLLYLCVSGKDKKPLSIPMQMVFRMIKLIGALIIIALYLYFIKINALSFVLGFVIFYIVYTLPETKILLDQNKKKAGNNA